MAQLPDASDFKMDTVLLTLSSGAKGRGTCIPLAY